MKRLSMFLTFFAILLMISGCNKDDIFTQSDNSLDLKNAKVPIPYKAELCAVPDMESDLILKPLPGLDPEDPSSYVTSRMIISGNATGMGKIDPAMSYYDIDVFELIFENDIPFLYQTGTGILVGANGDSYSYSWWAKASLPTLEFIGGNTIVSGTGRFEGVSGTSDMAGKIDELSLQNCWTLDGYVEFARD